MEQKNYLTKLAFFDNMCKQ